MHQTFYQSPLLHHIKMKILIFDFQIKLKNWNLTKNCFVWTIFKFQMKYKWTQMAFFISVSKWTLNGTFAAAINMNFISLAFVLFSLTKCKNEIKNLKSTINIH